MERIDHSLACRSRERLFIPAERWEKERDSYYRRLSLPKRAESYLEPLIERARAGVAAVAKAVEAGEQRVDDELHLTPLAADEEEPELVKLRRARSPDRRGAATGFAVASGCEDAIQLDRSISSANFSYGFRRCHLWMRQQCVLLALDEPTPDGYAPAPPRSATFLARASQD